MRSLLLFDSMLTPKIITGLYWLMLLFCVVAGGRLAFGGGEFHWFLFLQGLLLTLGCGVAARIWCELLIVLFKIHENLRKIANK